MKAAALALATALLAGLVPAALAEELPVTTVTVYPGDIVAATMVSTAAFPDGTAQKLPVVGATAELVGKVARRTILPGRLIALNAIATPDLVQKGAIVPAVYEDGVLTITASVLALQSGGLNDAIQVRNVDSGKVIVASVQADGSVRVGVR
jgi:flagella basal body P-ring formation protein FlgA